MFLLCSVYADAHEYCAAGASPTARSPSPTGRSDSLVPDPRNARTHPKRQIEQIVASIRAFGFTNPILVDPDGTVIAGHGRLLAAKAMGARRGADHHPRGAERGAEAGAAPCRQQDRPRCRLGRRPAEARACRAVDARRRLRPVGHRVLDRRDRRRAEGRRPIPTTR